MCGIYAVISQKPTSISAPLRQLLCNRGPDHFGLASFDLSPASSCSDPPPVTITSSDSLINVLLAASVLSLRASCPTPQPLVATETLGTRYADSFGLCWNGEAWKFDGAPITTSDTSFIYNILSSSADHEDVLCRLRRISGPFAIVFLCRWLGRMRLYLARDRLGRRSLLVRRDAENSSLAFSSVGDGQSGWEELPADGIYWLDVQDSDPRVHVRPENLPLVREDWVLESEAANQNMVSSLGLFNMSVLGLGLATVDAEATKKSASRGTAPSVAETAIGSASVVEVTATSVGSATGPLASSTPEAPRAAATAVDSVSSTTVTGAISVEETQAATMEAPKVTVEVPKTTVEAPEAVSEGPTTVASFTRGGDLAHPKTERNRAAIAPEPVLAHASASTAGLREQKAGTGLSDSMALFSLTSVSAPSTPAPCLDDTNTPSLKDTSTSGRDDMDNPVHDARSSEPVATSASSLDWSAFQMPKEMQDAAQRLRDLLTQSVYIRASSIPGISMELQAHDRETLQAAGQLARSASVPHERGLQDMTGHAGLVPNLLLPESGHSERLGVPEVVKQQDQDMRQTGLESLGGPTHELVAHEVLADDESEFDGQQPRSGEAMESSSSGQAPGSGSAELQAPAPSQARVAVLFSGGLDCTVLARLLSDILPAGEEIDLVNVAFENPRIAAQFAKEKKVVPDIYEECPDRITGRRAFDELQKCCPERRWRFIAANIPFAETTQHKDAVISLMAPHNTEMDLSIANALYFAARGTGQIYCSWDPRPGSTSAPAVGTTAARVLFSGLGADELFGGYIRHSTAFSRRGYAGLVDELKLDVARLGQRNLGRDDRVLSHWSRETRFPFLDEDLVRWAIGRPVQEKCDFHVADEVYGGIEAAKRVLRVVADGLGLHGAAREKKRAIQFGARTAKMQSGRVKGTAAI